MLKLIRYVKPYAFWALLCMFFVFAQAMCDLKLPDYMSNIVNIGIQRYGIEDAVPVKLSERTYQSLLLFMTADERDAAEKFYILPAGGGYAEYRQPDWMSRDVLDRYRQTMDAAFSRGFIVLAAIAQNMLPEGMPSGEELLTGLMQMSDGERMQIIDSINTQFDSLGSSVTSQISVAAIKAEYEAVGVDVEAIQRAAILRTGGKMLLFAALICMLSISAGLLSARVAASAARDIRGDVFKKVTTFSSAEVDKFSTASLITRTTNDVQQVQILLVMFMRNVVFAPSMGTGAIIYAIRKSVSLSWMIGLAVLILILIMVVIMSIVMPRFKKMQSLIDRLSLVTRENISGIMVSRAYNTQNFEAGRFDTANRAHASNSLSATRTMSFMWPSMGLLMNVLMLGIIWFGAHEIANSALNIGDMMAYMQYAMHVIFSFMFVSMMFVMIPRAAVSGERIQQVLTCENSIIDPENPVEITALPEKRGFVEFKNVSFRYPGAERSALENITFTAKPGQTTAIIGSTGSGKSSLAALIMRFYDATEGEVAVNGVDVRDLTQNSLRSQIGFVPQKSILFTGTISENVRFGAPDASDEQMERAASAAQATDFIRERENGYDEFISQGGSNVSGGQRQRLSIARALAVEAPIYIFDDSFSALDFKTDAALRRALKTHAEGSTMLIVAQRVGTIRSADQIIVLDEGKIAGIGTHKELMLSCEVYKEIARSQLREEELA